MFPQLIVLTQEEKKNMQEFYNSPSQRIRKWKSYVDECQGHVF